MEASKNTIVVGDRIHSGDHFGTVKYVGPVEGTKGTYFGVEWDDASRGKHNGTHKGKVYFETSDGESSASFVKEKLLKARCTCLEAVKTKYGKIEDESIGIDESEAFLPTTAAGRIVNIEVVGMKKVNDLQCQFDLLQVVDLAYTCVYGETDPDELGNFIPQCQELNLSYNLTNCWKSIADIVGKLPNLHTIHLLGNRFTKHDENVDDLAKSFASLQKLNISNTLLDWNSVVRYAPLWLHVKELYVCNNGINCMSPIPKFDSLQFLDLTGNPLTCWKNISGLTSLPKLNDLLLNNCQLAEIDVEEGSFSNLTRLSINQNMIPEWRYIGEFMKLTSLKELSFHSNPVLEIYDHETNRQLVIANVPTLKKLNRTEIDGLERKGAEIDYLRRFGADWIASGASLETTTKNKAFFKKHPAFKAAAKKWGVPDKKEVIQEKSSFKSSLIELQFTDETKADGKTITKKIPLSMTVQKVKVLAIKLLRLDIPTASISYRSKENGLEYELENDLRDLDYYSVSPGDKILVRC